MEGNSIELHHNNIIKIQINTCSGQTLGSNYLKEF